jgi:hypothetical protein
MLRESIARLKRQLNDKERELKMSVVPIPDAKAVTCSE